MQRPSVVSSNIHSVGYTRADRVWGIEFHSGSVYQYSGAPESVYLGLMNAVSKGSYFDAYIKKAAYSYRQVVQVPAGPPKPAADCWDTAW